MISLERFALAAESCAFRLASVKLDTSVQFPEPFPVPVLSQVPLFDGVPSL